MVRINAFRIFVISLLCTICSVSPSSAFTLYSGVAHSDYLAPVSDQPSTQNPPNPASAFSLAAQRTAPQPQFDGSAQQGHMDAYQTLPRLGGNVTTSATSAPTVEWFMIPKWMAGQWKKQGDLTVSYRDLRTNRFTSMSAWTENEMSISWGHQYDRMGNIWHADILPLEKDGWTKGKIARFIMVNLKCERSTPQELVTRARYLVTETWNGTTQVADVFQQESLNDYTMLQDGQLENISSNRIFSSRGQPLHEGGLVTRLQKYGPFAPQRYQNNIDLVQSLNSYLESHGMQSLMVSIQ
ncbi:MAG: hypothetical protein K2X93_24620 [Candidatus Obscuribacterales bacterium]|nr:hypothetical protein [Candidatus Obscuribacterales bacterium]